MSLATPDKIRNFQIKLYRKAKAEPDYRFYLLYDKICREDILEHAYALARSNGGAPGVDGMTFAQIEASGRAEWLADLRKDLSVGKLRTRIGEILVPGNPQPWPEVREQLNAVLRGWSAYFSYGTRLMAYRAVDNYVYRAVCRFLRRRHKVQSRGYRDFQVFGTLGVLRLRRVHLRPLPRKTPAWDKLPCDMR